MSVEKAAKSLILRGQVADGILNKIEMAFRAYGPCHGCAICATAGGPALELRIRDSAARLALR